MIRQVKFVGIPTKDQERALKFWTETMGLKVLTDQPLGNQRWIELQIPGAQTRVVLFTPEGHAIHGSPYVKRLGTRASHGCVRLAPENAAKLYALVQQTGMKNTRVVIRGGFDFDFGFSDFSSALPRRPNWTKRHNPFSDLFN